MNPPMLEIVCYYADLGRDYLPLFEKMINSARRTNPWAKITCMTPTPDKVGKRWDLVIDTGQFPAGSQNLILEKVRAIVSLGKTTDHHIVVADPDIEFIKPISFRNIADVGLLWRGKKPDQPINAGLIYITPGHPKFWEHYGEVAVNLPKEVHSWWCDQLAFALLTGVNHQPWETIEIDDARVTLLDGDVVCPKPENRQQHSWALHYKGALKGPGWEKVFRTKSRDGTSSPDWRSSTAMPRELNSASPPAEPPSISALSSPNSI